MPLYTPDVPKMSMTPGLLSAITRNGSRIVCACGMPIPKYPGRYPSKCPNCGKPLKDVRKEASIGDESSA